MELRLSTSRERTSSALVEVPKSTFSGNYYDLEYGYWGNPTTKTYPAVEYSFTGQETKDVVTEDFEKRRGAGEVIMNDFRSYRIQVANGELPWSAEYDYQSGGYRNVGTTVLYGIHMFGFSVPGAPSYSLERDADLCIARTLSKVGAAEMQIITTAAEFRKTVASLNRLYRVAWSLLRKAVKIQKLLGQGAITVAAATSAWLEIRYGLRPIMYDVRNAVEALNLLGKRKRVRYTSSLDEEVLQQTDPETQYGYGYFRANVISRRTHTYQLSTGVLCEARFTNVNTGFDVLGFDELLESAWELVPYSFIVDWFINVGEYIAALTPAYDLKVVGNWVKVLKESRVSYTPTKVWCTRGSSTSNMTMTADTPLYITHTCKERYTNVGSPSLPRLNIRLDGLKITDMLALMKQNAKHLRI